MKIQTDTPRHATPRSGGFRWRGVGKILRFLAGLLVAISLLKGPGMAQSLDHGYYARIQTDGIAWSLRVNDIFVRENVALGYITTDGNIGKQLQPGANTISLLFSPLTGETGAGGSYLFELRDGLLIDITIERRDFGTGESQEISAVRLRYDMAQADFVAEDKTAAGLDRMLAQPLLRTDGRYTISDLPPSRPITFWTGDRAEGYRLDVGIEVDAEELPPFHWRADAIRLEDTPELRKELMQAYQRLHGRIARGDRAAILQEARPVWERSAFILTTRASTAEEFVENSELGFDIFDQTHPDGSELQELRMLESVGEAALQFMDDGKLVRFRPDPIAWAMPPDSEDITSVFPVVFYRTASGEWHIADINIGF